jgi:hypothetical protein
VADHVAACCRAGVQAGFHAIGDAALTAVLDGFAAAADQVGLDVLRAGRHRVEHVELPTAQHVQAMADLGLVASVQPVFDARWAGPGGLYEQRLGVERTRASNPLGVLAAAGVPLALGSDSPVTPLDPWGAVRAAVRHHTPSSRLSARAAFSAHTRGGLAGRPGRRRRRPGAPARPATFAVWDVPGRAGRAGARRPGPGWSTDPRAGRLGLPDLDAPDPVCRRTVVEGAWSTTSTAAASGLTRRGTAGLARRLLTAQRGPRVGCPGPPTSPCPGPHPPALRVRTTSPGGRRQPHAPGADGRGHLGGGHQDRHPEVQ